MGGQGGDGGAAAAAPAPSTAPARGASRAVLLDQRKKEVQDAAVVGSLVKVVYAEAWTTRAGAAMSSGYGKQVLTRKLCHIGGGDKPDGSKEHTGTGSARVSVMHGQVGPSTARAVAARVPAPAHAHPRAYPSCAFAHREAGMFTDGHEQATARAVRGTGTQRARKPNEHKQATARAVRGTGTQRARKPKEHKQATARAARGTGTQRARKSKEHKQATARAVRGTGTQRARALNGHEHSTGTSTRRARALDGHEHSTGTSTRRARALDGHEHSTGTRNRTRSQTMRANQVPPDLSRRVRR